jgi:hypothetical protein
MKQFMMKKVIVSGLALAMIIGGSTSAFADNGKGNSKNNDKNDEKGKVSAKTNVNVRLSFDDVSGGDVEWAARYIASLASKQVFEGYEDGSFKPRNAISRIEAITAAVRLMGLRDQAESATKMATKLNFKDADKIPAWAVGYVAVALENDLFSESDVSVQPQKEADRLWATTLLVKALKLDAEAKTKMNTALTFKDAKQVPAGSVGYVAVAIEKGLINGFEDNTFRPNQPVTRAELAALLDRTGDQIVDNNTVTGTVSATVYNNVLSITKAGTPAQLVLDPNAFIYRDGLKVPATSLQIGDEVKVRSYNNLVIFVDAKSAAANTNFDVIGTLNETTPNATGQIARISITRNVNGVNQTELYNVSPTVAITGDLNLMVKDHLVELKGQNQLVTSIDIKIN